MADADTIYRVLTVYDADTHGAEAGASSLASALDHVINLMERAKEMVGGLLELHSAAENAQIAIAGMFSAASVGGVHAFNTSLGMSAEIIKQMRRDARELPGEFEDLQTVFQFSIIGGGQAGKSANEIEKMAANVMAVSKTFGLPSEVAGREFAELMEGRASARVALFSKLRPFMGEGMDSGKFNQLTAPEKWATMERALRGFAPMVEAYGRSWDAVYSTTVDFVKQLVRVGSESIFERLKGALEGINDWFARNQEAVELVARAVGDKLGGAFTWIVEVAAKMGPPLYAFFTGIYNVASLVFGTLGALLRSVAGVLGSVLGPALGGAGSNFETFGEIVATLMVGFGVYQVAVGAITVATAAWQAVQWAVNAAMTANPIGLMIVAVAALAAGILVLTSYWDDFVDSLGSAFDSNALRWLYKKAGYIPENATDAEIDQAMGGIREDKAARQKRLEQQFGDSGVVAHVKAMLQANGITTFTPSPQPAAPFGPDPAKLFSELLNAHGKPVAQKGDMRINVKIEQTINNADDPERVMIETHRALRDALVRPLESAGALVLK